MIHVANLVKEFRVYKHHRGGLGALRNLVSREYRVVRAVNDVSFDIGHGDLVGYLGPNGAGKSTTIKILTGILVPSGGRVVVEGRVPWLSRADHARHIGVVFGQRTNLWWDLPVVETFDLLRHIYRIPADRFEVNLRQFTDLLDLEPFLLTPVRSLSLGQRMRAEIAAALLHNPDLVFLDEPTIGLDVVAKERLRQFIRQMNQERGTTIILTTHDLGDVEKLCERVIMIDQGRKLYDGPLAALRDRFGRWRMLVVDFAEDYPDVAVNGLQAARREGARAWYRYDRAAVSTADLIAQVLARYRIQDLSVQEPEIEEIIRQIYEGGLLQEDTPTDA